MSDYPQAPAQRALPRPSLTIVLIAINALVFIAMAARAGSLSEFTNAQVIAWGADWGPLTLGGQPWRLLTSNYVHANAVHIALNMWCLWNLGLLAEAIFGRLVFFLLYTACGLAGSLLSLFWNPMVPSVGASGAVFGVAGALVAALYLGKLRIDPHVLRPTLRSLVSFVGYNLIFGFAVRAAGVGIDNAAHIGGLLMGLALGALLGQVLVEPQPFRRRKEIYLFLAATVVLLVSGLALQKTRGYVSLLNRASRAIEQHRLTDAVKDLEQVVARNPKNSMALVLLGNVYLQQKDYPHAESTLKKAAANDPGNLGVQYNLGLLYESTGRFEEARVIFEKLTTEDPDDDAAWVLLGGALDGLGRDADAIEAYKKAIAANPKNAEAFRELGLAQLKLQKLDDAVASFKQSTALTPDSPNAWRNLGQAYVALRRPFDAAQAFQKADQLSEKKQTQAN
jgi:rhomboid protease GluP